MQHRGEYLYAACGEGGVRVFDIAFIDDKAFSERITTAPVSPVGQKFYVRHEVRDRPSPPRRRSPVDPTRTQMPGEQGADGPPAVRLPVRLRQVRGADPDRRRRPRIDGNPLNNFLKREVTLQPGRPAERREARARSSALRLRLLRRRPRRGRHRRPEEPEGDLGGRREAPEAPAHGAGAVPLRATCATRRASRCSTSPTWRSRCRSRMIRIAGRPQHLPGPHLRLRRGRPARAGDPRHPERRRSRRSTRSTPPAGTSTTSTT